MAAQLGNYFVVKDEKHATLYVEGLSVTPRRVGNTVIFSMAWLLDEMASYLNMLAKADYEHKMLMDRLLEASLCGVNLNHIQNEVATLLSYPGIDGYIAERFARKDKEVRDGSSNTPAS